MEALRFFAPVTDQTAQRLIAFIDRARTSGVESVHLLIATTGGSTNAGITIYNFIRASGVKVIAVNMGMVESIGTVIFCAADERISMPQARFSFHPNTFKIQNAEMGVRQLEEKVNILNVEHEAIAIIISSATGRTIEEARDLIIGHRSFSATEAKNFGLVQDIQEFRIPTDAKVFAVDG